MAVSSFRRTWQSASPRARIGVGGGVALFILHILLFTGVFLRASEVAVVFNPYTHLLRVDGEYLFVLLTMIPGLVVGALTAGLYSRSTLSDSVHYTRFRILLAIIFTVVGLFVIALLLTAFLLFVYIEAQVIAETGILGIFFGIWVSLLGGAVYGTIAIFAFLSLYVIILVSVGLGWVSGELLWRLIQ